MHVSILAVRRPVLITVMILIVLLFGGISLQRIGIDLLPDLDFPVAVVVTIYPNASAEMIQKDVTIPIESSIASVSGIRQINSFTAENVSAVIIQFDWNTQMVEVLDDIRSRLTQVAFSLPSEAQAPFVARFDPNEFPLLLVGVSSDIANPFELTEKLSRLRPQLEQISGVAEVGLLGARQNEIEVLYDLDALYDASLTPMLLQQLLTYQNMIVPGGFIEKDGQRYTTRTGYRIQSMEELESLLVGYRRSTGVLSFGGLIPSLIQLSDVADISIQEKAVEGVTRFNGSDTLLLRITRQSGANTVQTATAVKRELAKLEELHPELTFTPLVDQSRFILDSIRSLAINGILGAILAVLVLYLFLRSIPSLIIISLAIPFSIIASFVMVYFGNLTMNIMTLGGLALGAGMLVDSSIVVLENIFRHLSDGADPKEASEAGSKEVASAILASTTTTLAVFLPVVFMQSVAGEIFKELGLTVSFSLLASFLVALTLVPMLTSKVFSAKDPALRRLRPTGMFSRLQNRYISLLEKTLRRKKRAFFLVMISLVITGFLIPKLGQEFLPEMDEGFISAQVMLPSGITFEEAKRMLIAFEQDILEVPEVQGVAVQAGEQGDTDVMGLIYGANLQNADIQITLSPKGQRNRSVKEISREIQYLGANYSFHRVTVVETALLGSQSGLFAPSIFIEIRGEDPVELNHLATTVREQLQQIEGFGQIQTSSDRSVEDIFFQVDPARGLLGGLTAGQIGLAVRQATMGITATELYLDGQVMPVVLRDKTRFDNLDTLLDSSITSPIPINGLGNNPVQLRQVVSAQSEPSPPNIQRTNRMQVVTITALLDTLHVTEASSLARRVLSSIEVPPGYILELGGIQHMIDESVRDLLLSLVFAIILVYLVLAAQFESFVHPFIILFSVPLAFIGAIVVMFLFDIRLGITSLMGLIVLSGIVVNNAIVLVDYMNILRKRGLNTQDAILQASRVRLRPILMTASTTVLGLIPLAIGLGEGGELQRPLALAVMGGLITSTLLTLFVIPVLYSIVARFTGDHLGRSLTASTFDSCELE